MTKKWYVVTPDGMDVFGGTKRECNAYLKQERDKGSPVDSLSIVTQKQSAAMSDRYFYELKARKTALREAIIDFPFAPKKPGMTVVEASETRMAFDIGHYQYFCLYNDIAPKKYWLVGREDLEVPGSITFYFRGSRESCIAIYNAILEILGYA